jgi:hypothetical protein
LRVGGAELGRPLPAVSSSSSKTPSSMAPMTQ